MSNKQLPPRWANQVLRWYCAPHLLEEVEGDLQEEFDYQLQYSGLFKARLDYIRSVFGFMKPFAIKRKHHTSTSNLTMTKHYLLVAFRNVVRHKTFATLNVFGLALGMTCCLFIYLWIQDERSMDNFHTNGDQLFNVYQTITADGRIEGSYNTPLQFDSLGPKIPIADITQIAPEVKAISFYATGYELPWGHPETLQVGNSIHKWNGARANENFLTMFSYPVIAGDAATALKDIKGMAISRKLADVYFGSPENAIGKSIRYENRIDFVVNAVFENVASNSTQQFDFLLNWESQMTQLAWASPAPLTSLLLSDASETKSVETKLNRLLQSRMDPNAPYKIELGLQPYRDQYLVAQFVNGKPQGGRFEYIRIFTYVALFILIIACINFMNLATARSIKRAKEVGVRKVVGSSRAGLIGQFFGESVVLALLGLLLSVVLVVSLLPAFNLFTGKHVQLQFNLPIVLLLHALVVFTGLVSGSYPALFLSGLKPAGILKNSLRFSKSSIWFRKGLATFQFVISIALLIATIVMTQQTHFIRNTNIGYDRENMVYISVEGELANPQGYQRFKQQASEVSGVLMVDRASETPHAMTFVVDRAEDGKTETADNSDAINWEGKEKGTPTGFKPMSVGFDFISTMNLKLADGRGFSRQFATDSADAFMVNEEAVKQMGLKDPIGKWVSAWNKRGHIIGVLKNYNTHSLHEPIKPLIVDVKEYENFGVLLVRIESGKTKETLEGLERVYKSINPNYAFAYQFLDEEYNKLYHTEHVVAQLSNAFAILAIIISCLGLLGLVMFSAEQRTKEFGIRKVLGASVNNIVSLLSVDFLKLVLLSFCIAAPLAGYAMHQWLQSFAYKIELSWWIFAASGVTALLIAFLTIAFQALQSATTNPVKSLKTE